MTNISVKKHNRKSRKNNRRKGGSNCEGVGLVTKSGLFSNYCAPEEEAVKDIETKEENTIFPPLFTSSDKEAPAVEGLTTPAEAQVEGLTAPAAAEVLAEVPAEVPAGEQQAPAVEVQGQPEKPTTGEQQAPAVEVQGQPEKPTTGGKNKKSKKQSKRKTAKKGGNKKQNKSKKNSRKNRSKK